MGKIDGATAAAAEAEAAPNKQLIYDIVYAANE